MKVNMAHCLDIEKPDRIRKVPVKDACHDMSGFGDSTLFPDGKRFVRTRIIALSLSNIQLVHSRHET